MKIGILFILSTLTWHLAFTQSNLTYTINWQKFTGSSGIYGVTHNNAKPLQYKPATNTTVFSHLKNTTYTSSPANTKNDVVFMVSNNNGTTWDSTCVWSNATNGAMFPQGAIFNPVGNTNYINTWGVTTGITTNSNNAITGNFYASKQLSAFTSTPALGVNEVQFYPSTGTFSPTFSKQHYVCNSISSTNDGQIKTIGILANDVNSSNTIAFGLRGVYYTKGVFNMGYFNWSGDSILPTTILKTDGTKQLYKFPLVAFNSAGTVGYIVLIGSTPSAQAVNTGWQPIVYKTTNSGTTWVLVNSMYFNNPLFAQILNKLKSVTTNTTLIIPQFNVNEGIDITVDINDNLHIATTISSTKSSHIDSLHLAHQYGVEGYKWKHTPANRPYLYDFLTNGSGWSYMLVDSLSTETAGKTQLDSGYTYNNWDADVNGNKVSNNARIQLSRSDNGRFIIYSFAESDTNITATPNGGHWNIYPNTHIKMYDATTNGLATNKINVTNPPTTANFNIKNKACFHNSSPILESASGNIGYNIGGGCVSGGSVNISLPITISNNFSFSQNSKVNHWYSSARFSINNIIISNSFPPFVYNTGIHTIDATITKLNIYPNPASEIIDAELNELNPSTSLRTTDYKLKIINSIGQLIREEEITFKDGKASVNTKGLANGVYVLSLRVGDEGVVSRSVTKRFVIAR